MEALHANTSAAHTARWARACVIGGNTGVAFFGIFDVGSGKCGRVYFGFCGVHAAFCF
jgi:hypothetical protein